ncbi:hypothetical protein [Hymenobacter tibetensis]|nr:hypothetical protein [Hymenobacter tibetensis]
MLLFTQALIQVVSGFYPFSSLLSAELPLYVGVISTFVAFLVYHR